MNILLYLNQVLHFQSQMNYIFKIISFLGGDQIMVLNLDVITYNLVQIKLSVPK